MTEFGKKFGIARQYESVDVMLKDGNVDAQVVSTPNYLHASQTIAAFIPRLPRNSSTRITTISGKSMSSMFAITGQ